MEEEFHKVTLKDGGRYVCNFSDNDILILDKLNEITLFANRIKKEVNCLPYFYVDIINNDNINASAILSNSGKYFIGIYKGAIVKLDSIFSNAVDNDLFYSRVNIKKHNSSKYKELCLRYALEFLVAHEASHIRFGHLKVGLEDKELYALYETYSTKTSSDFIFSQTLEMDADCCGIATVLNRILVDNLKIKDYIERFLDLEEKIYCLSFAVQYVNELFYKSVHKILDLDSYDHPHPGIRQFYISANIVTILAKLFNETNVNTFALAQTDAMFAVERIYHDANIEKTKMPLMIFFTEKGQQHTIRLCEEWESVREILKNFSYDNLAPYEKLKFEPKFVLF